MAEIDVSGSCEFASDWIVSWQGGAMSSLQEATGVTGGWLRMAEAGRPKTWCDIRRHRRWQ